MNLKPPRLLAFGCGLLALAAVAAVAAAYLTPDMVVELATRVWTCF